MGEKMTRPSYYEIYDELVVKMLPFYPEMHTEMVKLIDKTKNDEFTVLDLGFGTGTLTIRIFDAFTQVKVVGVDNSQSNIDKALPKLKGKNFNYQLANFTDLDFKKLKFDRVVSALSIHHLSKKEKQEIFQKIYDTLPKGGRLIIGDIVKSPKEEEWHQDMVKNMGEEGEYRWQTHKNSKKDKPSTLAEQLKWLEEAGFKAIVVKEWFNFNVFYGEK